VNVAGKLRFDFGIAMVPLNYQQEDSVQTQCTMYCEIN